MRNEDWTNWEDNYLKKYYEKLGPSKVWRAMKREFNSPRSLRAIEWRAHKLGLMHNSENFRVAKKILVALQDGPLLTSELAIATDESTDAVRYALKVMESKGWTVRRGTRLNAALGRSWPSWALPDGRPSDPAPPKPPPRRTALIERLKEHGDNPFRGMFL
jgi:hypothetical protein